MKLYEKIIDGTLQCLPQNKIVIVHNGMQTFNPTEEMLIENGWHEHKIYELSNEELILQARQNLKTDIENYDSSNEINKFYIRGEEVWFDKITRSGLMLRLQAEQTLGKENTVLWHNGQKFEMSVIDASQMLHALEIYASQCYDNTQRHLSNVDDLQSITAIENYHYMEGYPTILEF